MNPFFVKSVGVIVVAGGAYLAGHASGLRDCGQFAAQEMARQEALSEEIEAVFAAPTPYDQTCDAVFSLVRDQIDRSNLDEQAERAEIPDR